MRLKPLIMVVAACLLVAGPGTAGGETAGGETAGRAEEWTRRLSFSGLLETIHSMRAQTPHDTLTSRARMRLELGMDLDSAYGFVSADTEKNWRLSSETGTGIHEAWLEHVGNGWDARIGRQIIIWGKADGVQITDIISPPDYTESVTRTLDEIRMPVDAVKLRLLGQWADTELIWIPKFRAGVLATGDNPWALEQSPSQNVRVSSACSDEPGFSLADSEVALKVSAYLPGWDVAASIFYTRDDFPAMHRAVSVQEGEFRVTYAPKYHRMTVFGLEFSRPWSDFVFRSEAACYLGRYFEPASVFENPVQKNSLKWLGGVDWTPGSDWTITAQLVGEHVFGHSQKLNQAANIYLTTLNISKKLLNQTLTLSNMLYCNMNQGDFFDQVKADYAVTDALHFLAGADLFDGCRHGQYGRYKDNTQVWIRVKYSF
jgi:hypothetical protein